jgi:HAD superfamily hydrolase (TIGR01509 family)
MKSGCAYGVVWDLDGTLLDSLSSVLNALKYALDPYAREPIDLGIFAHLGGPPDRFFGKFVQDPSMVEPALKRFHEYSASHGWNIAPFPGASETLHKMKDMGIRLAVWTGRDRESAFEAFASYGWEGLFDAVVCGDDLVTHKPSPEGMDAIVSTLAVPRENLLFVGDSDVDAKAGHACGVRTLLIRGGRKLDPSIEALVWQHSNDASGAYLRALEWCRTVGY